MIWVLTLYEMYGMEIFPLILWFALVTFNDNAVKFSF